MDFLGTQVAALGGTAITYGMFRYARDREADELYGTNRLSEKWHQRAEDIRLVNLDFVAGFLAVAAIGIVQANIAFVSERPEKKKRDLPPLGTSQGPRRAARVIPPLSAIAPVVSPLPGRDGAPGGLFVGVQGAAF